MEVTAQKNASLKGGEWLLKESNPAHIFTPEDFTEEHKMIEEMCGQFYATEILPNLDRIDKKEPGLLPLLLEKCGDAGLIAATFPEQYGGLGKDLITATIISEGLGDNSFAVSYGVQKGIGSMPILYFGTEAQRQKYIPKIATAEWKAAYGLTEPNSGSDALSAKTTAVLSEDGKHYILNGQKCWITNGGFADVYSVFAKIDGDKFTGFIIERGMEGFTQGAEEHKMGIKGSSTVQLYFQDCKVPVENVLGEVGRGHIIAFNILNIGRYILCAASIGASKESTNLALRYAVAREQFKTPIANFGAIKHKLAEMAIRIWVADAAMYRTGKMIDDKEAELKATGASFEKAYLGAAEEYAVECAMLKVYGSEVLDFVVDEGVQIHGGNGFSDEYEISRAYRDSRISRIFEGTNEINRLLTVDMLIKRAMKGSLDLMGGSIAVSKELMGIPEFGNEDETPFAKEKKCIANFKKAILLVTGAAVQKLMTRLEKEQEILMNIADMAIDTYNAESALLRVMKMTETPNETAIALQTDIMRTYLYDAADRIGNNAKSALNSFAEGDELKIMHIGIKRFTKVEPFNTKAARRRIADEMIDKNGYCF